MLAGDLISEKYCRSAGNSAVSARQLKRSLQTKADDLHLAKFMMSSWNYS